MLFMWMKASFKIVAFKAIITALLFANLKLFSISTVLKRNRFYFKAISNGSLSCQSLGHTCHVLSKNSLSTAKFIEMAI